MTHMRKLALAAVTAAAMLLLVAPIGAQASSKWQVNVGGEWQSPPGGAGVDIVGEISFSTNNFVMGPCPMDIGGSLVNPGGAAGGAVVSLYGGDCGTNYGMCSLEEIYGEYMPWEMAVVGQESVSFKNTAFATYFASGCSSLGLPSKFEWGGTFAGQWHNETESGTGCLEYKNAEGLKATKSSTTFKVNGELCFWSEGRAVRLQ